LTRHGFHYISVGRPPAMPEQPASTPDNAHSLAGVPDQVANLR